MHFVYLCTRSLLMPMLLHFLSNTFAVLLTAADAPRVPGFRTVAAAVEVHPVWFLLASLPLLLAVGWALQQTCVRFRTVDGRLWHRPFPGVSPPPGRGAVTFSAPLDVRSIALMAGGVCILAVVCVMSAGAPASGGMER